jgi:hypothetical protein
VFNRAPDPQPPYAEHLGIGRGMIVVQIERPVSKRTLTVTETKLQPQQKERRSR